jgi:hypothetical protein
VSERNKLDQLESIRIPAIQPSDRVLPTLAFA